MDSCNPAALDVIVSVVCFFSIQRLDGIYNQDEQETLVPTVPGGGICSKVIFLSRARASRALALQPRSRHGGLIEVDETALHRARPPHRRGQEGLESKSDQAHPSGYLPQVRKQVRARMFSTASIANQ